MRKAHARDDPGMTLKLLIVDDSELVRNRLLGLLADVCGIADIATADTLTRALEHVQSDAPSLLVLDLHLPDGNAARVIPDFKRLAPGLRIAVLTNDPNKFNRNVCVLAGADWFFDKSTEFPQLIALVQQQAAQQSIPNGASA